MNDAIFLKDIEGLISNNTLFTALQTYTSNKFPSSDLFSTDELQEKATEYFFHSGDKRLSKIARYWLTNAVDLTAFIAIVIKAFKSRFGDNLTRVQDAYLKEVYKPLENYSMIEKRTPYLKEVTDTESDFKTHNETSAKVYGFNSSEGVPASESSSDTYGYKADNKQKTTINKTGHEDLTRSGNIGVTTSQQMLQSELDLRKFDFWEEVFRDLDRLICQQVY